MEVNEGQREKRVESRERERGEHMERQNEAKVKLG